MVGGRTLEARTPNISALIPSSSAAKHEQFESGYGSTNSPSDDSSKQQRIFTAKSRRHRPQTPVSKVGIRRSKSVVHNTHQCNSTEHLSRKKQQLKKSNLDLINSYHQLKRARISIDATPIHQAYKTEYNKQLHSKRTDIPNEHTRKLHTLVKKENDVVNYYDDWDSDYSDDWETNSNDTPETVVVQKLTPSENKISNNVMDLVPSDSAAFEVSFCRKRQAAIDICHTGKRSRVGLLKSIIDRAWIIFYWISQNIEYDVEAFFSGNIQHQTSNDIFANRKGVCDAFGTIFENLCTALQIECKKISGYAKGYSFKLGEKSFARTNHAWNVVRLEGHWYLIDSTWGPGHLDNNNLNKRELDPFYFLTRPEQMIYRHLPEDPKWQLLMSPISIDDFIRLPYVYPRFFEHNFDVIYPRHTNIALFNSSLGHAELLVQASCDARLMGDIEQTGSMKIRNGSLIQYDVDRHLWQCLFAPQNSGSHTLTLYARREKQTIENKTDESKYSCAIQFGLHVSNDVTKRKTFPLIYGLFTERKCQIIEPLDGVLKSGSKVTIHCRIPGAYCARLSLDGNWLSENLIKDDIFKRQITVPRKAITMYVKFSDKQNSSSYDGLFCYSVK